MLVHLMREAISGHQRPSGVIRGVLLVHLRVVRRHADLVIIGHQRSSEAIRGHQRSIEVVRGHPTVYQDGDTPRDRQEIDVAEEDREPHDGATKPPLVLAAAHLMRDAIKGTQHDGATKPPLVLAAAHHWSRSTPSPRRARRHRHVDRAERLVVPGHELVEDLRGNQRQSK